MSRNNRFAIVVSRFNERLTKNLVQGALAGFLEAGIPEQEIPVVWVPGAFEIPLVAQKLAATKKYAAILCLGVLIKGETTHFEMVAEQNASGIMQASLNTGIPLIYYVITSPNLALAEARCGINGSPNLGHTGAGTALEMANLLNSGKSPFAS